MAPSAHGQELPLPKRLVGDYGYWSRDQDPPYSAAQIPFRKLTHVNHAGVSFREDGSLSVPEGFLEPELNRRAHAAGVRVLLLLGGDFAGLEARGALGVLVANIARFAGEHGYDGVDLDWEYPETRSDRSFLVELVDELRRSNTDYVLSIDVPPWGGQGYDLARLRRTLDYFNIMMYDCAGPWTAYGQLNSPIFWDPSDPAPYECQPGGSAQEAADIFLREVPAAQLNLGTPFYGYWYSNIDALFGFCPNAAHDPGRVCGNTVTSVSYAQLKPWIDHAWERHRDRIAQVPYLLRADGGEGYVTYDDAASTYDRVWYSDWTRGLGGTFMWSLDADYDGHSQDLLDAMYRATLGNAQVAPTF